MRARREDPTENDSRSLGARLPRGTRSRIVERLTLTWCGALTRIRRVLHDAKWFVTVDDHKIVWDQQNQAFDPTG
jgi:hypothetical protein